MVEWVRVRDLEIMWFSTRRLGTVYHMEYIFIIELTFYFTQSSVIFCMSFPFSATVLVRIRLHKYLVRIRKLLYLGLNKPFVSVQHVTKVAYFHRLFPRVTKL